jgi:DNA polymerase (family 10)
LRDIATLLVLQGGAGFKVRAYRRAAASIESTGLDLGELVDQGRLTELPNVGEGIARTVAELWQTGHSSLRERLAAELPPGSLELARLPGLTLKRIRALNEALGVSTIAEVRAACERQDVRKVKGFGERTEQRILEGIRTFLTRSTRALLSEALATSDLLAAFLRSSPGVEDVVLVGEARRRVETVDRIALVARAREGAGTDSVAEHFLRYPGFAMVEREPLRGRLAGGLPVELHVPARERFSDEVLALTGTDDHVRRVLARLPPERAAFASESELYAKAGLQWVPPEIREDQGEIEAAGSGRLEPLVRDEDIRGFVHCHTRYSDGRHSIEEMARAAESLGVQYITITDHSPSAHYAGGVSLDRLKEQWDEIARVQEQVSVRILRGTESDILADGALDYDDRTLEQFDVVIASIHARMRLDRDAMTRRIERAMCHPLFKIWGHALGRLLLRRPPVDCDVERLLDVIAAERAAIEVNGDPHRLDLEPRWVRAAQERGIRFVVSCDAHSTRGLGATRFGVMMARRGGLRPTDVLNTLDASAFVRAVRPAA